MTRPDRPGAGQQEEIVFVEAGWDLPQRYRGDPVLTLFFEELAHNRRLVGGAVSGGDRVIFPPASFCEVTYADVTALVPVGPFGTIRGLTKVRTTFSDGVRPPYLIAYVQLDNASTAAAGYLRGRDGSDLSAAGLVGRRCRAVIAPEPKGHWDDFWFELEDER